MAEPTQHVAIITGLSGAGKTAASKLFEDLGYTVVDNLPAELLRDLAELVANDPVRYRPRRLVLDVAPGDAPLALGAALGALEGRGISPRSSSWRPATTSLIRRYSETRHRHPLDTANDGVAAAIAARAPAARRGPRRGADVIIDTSDLSASAAARAHRWRRSARTPEPEQLVAPGHQLRLQVRRAARGGPRLRRPLHGEPLLPTGLRASSGLTEPVRDFVLGPAHHPSGSSSIVRRASSPSLIPAYQAEGKTRLTVPSAAPAASIARSPSPRTLAARLADRHLGPVRVWHRELEQRR